MKTLDFIKSLELPSGGIAAKMGEAAYPEVTGYLIPTLFDYGEDALALRLAKWLVTIQCADGGFMDMDGNERTFDTAAIVEGLRRANDERPSREFKQAVERAVAWLYQQERGDGALRVMPGSDTTHLYTLRASWIMGSKAGIEHWIKREWPDTRVHYIAYALEGLWGAGENEMVRRHLEASQRVITFSGLMPMTIIPGWKAGRGTDTCATCQMAILYQRAWMTDQALELREAAKQMVYPDGSISLGMDHPNECNSWTAKWYLDMEMAIND